MRHHTFALLIGGLALAACGEMATLPVSAGTGAQPVLPAPQKPIFSLHLTCTLNCTLESLINY
jgi:hypothetical protein